MVLHIHMLVPLVVVQACVCVCCSILSILIGVGLEVAETRAGGEARLKAMIDKGTAKVVEDEDGHEMVYFKVVKIGSKDSHGTSHKSARSKATTGDAHAALKKLVLEYGWSINASSAAFEDTMSKNTS